MEEIWKKFKNRILLESILIGALLGLSCGLIGSAIFYFIFVLCGLKLGAWVYVLIGLSFFIISFVLYLCFNKINDKKVARRLDKELNLNEKCITMVEFKGQSGTLIEEQRSDAKDALSKKSPKDVKIKLASFSLPLFLVACLSFGTSMFTQQIKSGIEEIVNPIEDIDDNTEEKIDDIIDIIDNSKADQALKDKLYEILDDLKDDLKGIRDTDTRKKLVDEAKVKVDEAVSEVNTKEDIATCLTKKDDVALKNIGQAILDKNSSTLSTSFSVLKNEVSKESGDELYNVLIEIAKEIKEALNESNQKEGDDLYDAFNYLANKLNELAEDLKSLKKDEETVKKEAETTIENAYSDIVAALNQQITNETLGENVKKRMDDLISTDKKASGSDSGNNNGSSNGSDEGSDSEDSNNSGENGDTSGGDSGTSDKEEGDNGDDSGNAEGDGQGEGDSSSGNGGGSGAGGGDGGSGAGGGSGNVTYKGDDKIYTGNSSKDDGYESYGDAMSDYQNGMIEGGEESDDSEIKDAINDYLNSLYGNEGDDDGDDDNKDDDENNSSDGGDN